MKIFVDQPELENVILDFPKYGKAISEIILDSTPHFTVGIFGEWGTGKSTLMKYIRNVIKLSNVNFLEFNAWRYEGEERIATFPLMLEILGNLLQNSEIQDYLDNQEPEIKEKLTSKIGRVLKGLSFSGGINLGIFNAQANYDVDKVPDAKIPDAKPKLDVADLWNFYDETKSTLQEGVEVIQLLLENTFGAENNEDLKLVVFIDDLDRCTPEKASQVFESIKVFFDQLGIVFVLGLSKKVIEAAIDEKYKHFNKENDKIFNGADYLKKIIQVPFTLPEWSESDLLKYIETLLSRQDKSGHEDFLKSEIPLICQAVDSNPREVKRLLNNFMMAKSIYGNDQGVEEKILFIFQAISMRWRWFYDEIFENLTLTKNLDIVGIIKTSLFKNGQLDIPNFDTPEQMTQKNPRIIDKIWMDKELLKLLQDKASPIFDMNYDQWMAYRRATSPSSQFYTFDHEHESQGTKWLRKTEDELNRARTREEEEERKRAQKLEESTTLQKIEKEIAELEHEDKIQEKEYDKLKDLAEKMEKEDPKSKIAQEYHEQVNKIYADHLVREKTIQELKTKLREMNPDVHYDEKK